MKLLILIALLMFIWSRPSSADTASDLESVSFASEQCKRGDSPSCSAFPTLLSIACSNTPNGKACAYIEQMRVTKTDDQLFNLCHTGIIQLCN